MRWFTGVRPGFRTGCGHGLRPAPPRPADRPVWSPGPVPAGAGRDGGGDLHRRSAESAGPARQAGHPPHGAAPPGRGRACSVRDTT